MPYDITNYQIQLIGTGMQCPNTFNEANGRVRTNTGIERINQSIRHILLTRIGERFFVPEFGSRLHELIFEPNDEVLRDLLKLYIDDALRKWEPRIKVLEIEPIIKDYDNTVPVNITYNLINTNVTYNYVFPFNREVYTLSSYSAQESSLPY